MKILIAFAVQRKHILIKKNYYGIFSACWYGGRSSDALTAHFLAPSNDTGSSFLFAKMTLFGDTSTLFDMFRVFGGKGPCQPKKTRPSGWKTAR
mmetsp:Transcript_13372/g.31471  ORF Transcript_13372/g.31471 Transcript_13372/m.31471 type:complete len:94 (+) Transcript_13372:4659-4940(+)